MRGQNCTSKESFVWHPVRRDSKNIEVLNMASSKEVELLGKDFRILEVL